MVPVFVLNIRMVISAFERGHQTSNGRLFPALECTVITIHERNIREKVQSKVSCDEQKFGAGASRM